MGFRVYGLVVNGVRVSGFTGLRVCVEDSMLYLRFWDSGSRVKGSNNGQPVISSTSAYEKYSSVPSWAEQNSHQGRSGSHLKSTRVWIYFITGPGNVNVVNSGLTVSKRS